MRLRCLLPSWLLSSIGLKSVSERRVSYFQNQGATAMPYHKGSRERPDNVVRRSHLCGCTGSFCDQLIFLRDTGLQTCLCRAPLRAAFCQVPDVTLPVRSLFEDLISIDVPRVFRRFTNTRQYSVYMYFYNIALRYYHESQPIG